MSVLNAGNSSIASRCPPRVYSKRSSTANSLGTDESPQNED